MSAPEWLVPGAPVLVVERASYGPDTVDARWCTVAKVGKTHFTVEGVREGFTTRTDLGLTKFRVERIPARGAADSRMEAYPPDHADALRKLAGVKRKRAEDEVSHAFEQWRKARQTQAYSREPEGDRAGTLYALADAVVALRGLYDTQGVVPADPPNVD